MSNQTYDRPADLARFAGFVAPTLGRALWRSTRASVRVRRLGRPPAGVPVLDYDPLDLQAAQQPHEVYRRLLAGPPVHYLPRRRCWVISHHEHVRNALRATDALTSSAGPTPFDPAVEVMLTTDDPEHTRLRRIAQPAFTRRAIDGWTVMIDQLARDLVSDALTATGAPDVVESIAVPLPMRVIASFLGIREDQYLEFHRWSDAIAKTPTLSLGVGARTVTETFGGFASLYSYLRQEIEGGSLNASDSALGRVYRANANGDITPESLFFFAVLMLVAGNETTTTLLSTLIHNLALRPDQFEILRADPDRIPNAVEEAVRHSTPIQCFYRTAVSDYRVEGVTIPAGSRVLISYAAANRDPRVFPDPDQFLVTRANAPQHVGFGHGPHLCIGAQLSRLEARAILRELVDRVDRIELAGEPAWASNGLMRGMTSVRVNLLPARQGAVAR